MVMVPAEVLSATAQQGAMVARTWQVLAGVSDPEIPVISVVDLGIIRAVTQDAQGVQVQVTPTYAGCPATHVIEADIIAALAAAGVMARIVTSLAPAWSTDWITDQGRARLAEYGIAPPGQGAVDATHGSSSRGPGTLKLQFHPACPQCGSIHTECLSQFGSTPCKALHRCIDCREPFDYFKPL